MTTTFEDPQYLEAVYAALFDLLKSAVFPEGISWETTERIVVVPDQVAVANQPALLLIEGPMHAEQVQLMGPTKWVFTAVAAIYVRADGSASPNPLPAQVANWLIWGVVNAFNTRPPYQKQTLGGLVYNAWISGEVLSSVTEQQMVITIPINMLPGPVS